MWPPTITDCECEKPGWCERHQCLKSPHFHRLCRRNQEYYQLWEEGLGPCIPFPGQEDQTDKRSEEPGLLRKAVNFGIAAVRHVADGGKQVSDETFEARIAVCIVCDSCDRQRMVCREPNCGCYIEKKARWQSEECPLGKWSLLEGEPINSQSSDEAQA